MPTVRDCGCRRRDVKKNMNAAKGERRGGERKKQSYGRLSLSCSIQYERKLKCGNQCRAKEQEDAYLKTELTNEGYCFAIKIISAPCVKV